MEAHIIVKIIVHAIMMEYVNVKMDILVYIVIKQIVNQYD
jgi:hypothetical protein